MLKEAIDLQQNAVSQLLDITSVKNEITFKAPTGSGKTYMMADFMNRVLTDNKDIVFLVSTLSKGNLAKQNFDKFTEYFKTGKFNHLKPYLINTDVSDEQALFMAKDIAKKIEKEMEYPGQIKVNVIRETRNVDYAK